MGPWFHRHINSFQRWKRWFLSTKISSFVSLSFLFTKYTCFNSIPCTRCNNIQVESCVIKCNSISKLTKHWNKNDYLIPIPKFHSDSTQNNYIATILVVVTVTSTILTIFTAFKWITIWSHLLYHEPDHRYKIKIICTLQTQIQYQHIRSLTLW